MVYDNGKFLHMVHDNGELSGHLSAVNKHIRRAQSAVLILSVLYCTEGQEFCLMLFLL